MSLYWQASSEADYDWLGFYIDGVRQDRISGRVDWQLKSYSVTGTGTHSLLWQYVKDSSGEDGDDGGWVDYLQWTPSSGALTPAWETVEYTYDPSGRRIAKTFDGVLTNQYVYDGDNIIAEYDGSGNLVRKYIQGAGIDQPVSMIDVEDSNATYYYHYDALGSVVALSNASGTTVEVYEYSAFGEIAATDANNPNPFTFTGREFDKETGLYCYRARYYAPEIGRFLQTDPIGYDGGMNVYWYCMNNPWNLTDPSGETTAGPNTPNPCEKEEQRVIAAQKWMTDMAAKRKSADEAYWDAFRYEVDAAGEYGTALRAKTKAERDAGIAEKAFATAAGGAAAVCYGAGKTIPGIIGCLAAMAATAVAYEIMLDALADKDQAWADLVAAQKVWHKAIALRQSKYWDYVYWDGLYTDALGGLKKAENALSECRKKNGIAGEKAGLNSASYGGSNSYASGGTTTSICVSVSGRLSPLCTSL